MAGSPRASAMRCSRKLSTTTTAVFSRQVWPTICRRPTTKFRKSNFSTSRPQARTQSRAPKVSVKAARSEPRLQLSTQSMMRCRPSEWRSTSCRRRRKEFARCCGPGKRQYERKYSTLRPFPRKRESRPTANTFALGPRFRGEERTRGIMSIKSNITLTINGRDHAIAVEPRRTLADAIREDCGQTGTHIGCEHGICGACTVIVDGEPVRSCLMFAVQANSKKIRTVEGLADGEKLHPMQQAFMDHHGLQCGFCTPGFLMLAVGVLEREPYISDGDLLDVLSSNLCRCTGYQNIIKAVRAAAKEMRK